MPFAVAAVLRVPWAARKDVKRMGDLYFTELLRRQLETSHSLSLCLGFLFSKMGSGITAQLIKSLPLCHSPATQDGKGL